MDNDQPFWQPRELIGFGVAGLLGEDCRVFHHPLKGTISIGRLTDLLALKLRLPVQQELELRTALIRIGMGSLDATAKGHPVSMECGIDTDRIAVSVSFTVPRNLRFGLEKLRSEMADPAPKDPWASFLKDSLNRQLGIVVRWQERRRKLELTVIIGLQGPIDFFELVEVPDSNKTKARPFSYTEVGDLAREISRMAVEAPIELIRAERDSRAGRYGFLNRIGRFFKGLWGSDEQGNEQLLLDLDAQVDPSATDETPLDLTPLDFPELHEPIPDGSAEFEDMMRGIDHLSQVIRKDSIRFEEASAPIRDNIHNSAAKRLFDRTVRDMVNERIEMRESTRKMLGVMRQFENEKKKRQYVVRQELKEREDVIRQKSQLLERAKEQLVAASVEIERVRGAAAKSSFVNTDAELVKAKLLQVSKELQLTRDTNSTLGAKVDELKTKLNMERNNQMVRAQTSSDAELKTKSERALKENGDLRKANQRLIEKLEGIQKKQGTEGEAEENRKRLGAASKMIGTQKRDLERLHVLVEESRRQESALKGELKKIQTELMRYKTGVKKAS